MQEKKKGYSVTEYFVMLWFLGVIGYGFFKVLFTDDMGGENLMRNMGFIVGVCFMMTVALEIGRRILTSSKTN